MSRPPTPMLPPKKDVATLLLQGPSVFIHLDPRKPQVVVPAWFKKQPQLVLQVGLNMAVPIPDLHLDDEGVSATLSFNRSPFWCRIPWSAIYALVGEDGRGMIWPDEVPAEVAAQMQVQEAKRAQQARLRAVPNPEERAQEDREEQSTNADTCPHSDGRPAAEQRPAAADSSEQASASGDAAGPSGTDATSGAQPDILEPTGRPKAPSKPKKGAPRRGSRKGGKDEPVLSAAGRDGLTATDEGSTGAPQAVPGGRMGPPIKGKGDARPVPESDQPGKRKRELPPYLRVIK